MFFTLCLLGTTAAGSVAIIIAGLRRAPEAYEDDEGLRIIQDSRRRPAHASSSAFAATRGGSDNSHAGTAKRFNLQLAEWYGGDAARRIKYAEAFEICEYGRLPGKEEIRKLFPFFPSR